MGVEVDGPRICYRELSLVLGHDIGTGTTLGDTAQCGWNTAKTTSRAKEMHCGINQS
jgi:hypothetical protein